MKVFKCEKCGAALFTGSFVGEINIKCKNCGHMNHIENDPYSLPESKKAKLLFGIEQKPGLN